MNNWNSAQKDFYASGNINFILDWMRYDDNKNHSTYHIIAEHVQRIKNGSETKQQFMELTELGKDTFLLLFKRCYQNRFSATDNYW